MRMVNAAGRAGLLVDGEVFDLERLSGGTLPSDPMAVIAGHWAAAFRLHAQGSFTGGTPVEEVTLEAPVPRPPSLFGVGLNYRTHAAETGAQVPEVPAIFTKFSSCLTGPFSDVVLPATEQTADWEAELAFVVARGGRRIPAADALDHLAGFTAAQDISERRIQRAAGFQFCMGKSFDTFCPLGPALVTLDELADPLDLGITCRVNGEVMQAARTSDMIVGVRQLVEFLSSILTLRPGDLCLTGTPDGVGVARDPQVFLRPGDVIETEIEGIGAMCNRCVADPG